MSADISQIAAEALRRTIDTDLVRVCTAGSVDDGKSTLIGRLLHDTRSVMADQLQSVLRSTKDGERFDLALLTDGLRAEREQGITIDVAHRYFTTPHRTFILADTPGHAQYTRNMVTGASTADIAVVLVDVRHGLLDQSRRHLAIAAMLRVRHVVVAVNKMDLVGFDRAAFTAIADEVAALVARLGITSLHVVPVSALEGDNVVDESTNTPWYDGLPLLSLLETLPVDRTHTGPFRMAVQGVIRDGERRRYTGRIAGGEVHVGDEVVVQPGAHRTTVTAIHTADGESDVAETGRSVGIELAHQLDAGRGAVLGAAAQPAIETRSLFATVCWMVTSPGTAGRRLVLKHTTSTVPCILDAIEERIDPVTLDRAPTTELVLNDLASVRLRLASPVFGDRYADNRTTGSAILIDPNTNDTVASVLFDRLDA